MDVLELVQRPESQRDEVWEKEFLQGIVTTKVEVVKERPEQGPDGWPYLLLRTGTERGQLFTQVLQWAYTRGVGLALNTHKMMPDYVFTYGMVWNFAETGRFVSDAAPASPGDVVLSSGTATLIGPPTEKYLPRYVRDVLRGFLQAQGFARPRMVVISSADYKTVDLAFSLESLGEPPEARHASLAESIHWFLPMHYSLVFASEQKLRGFSDL